VKKKRRQCCLEAETKLAKAAISAFCVRLLKAWRENSMALHRRLKAPSVNDYQQKSVLWRPISISMWKWEKIPEENAMKIYIISNSEKWLCEEYSERKWTGCYLPEEKYRKSISSLAALALPSETLNALGGEAIQRNEEEREAEKLELVRISEASCSEKREGSPLNLYSRRYREND